MVNIYDVIRGISFSTDDLAEHVIEPVVWLIMPCSAPLKKNYTLAFHWKKNYTLIPITHNEKSDIAMTILNNSICLNYEIFSQTARQQLRLQPLDVIAYGHRFTICLYGSLRSPMTFSNTFIFLFEGIVWWWIVNNNYVRNSFHFVKSHCIPVFYSIIFFWQGFWWQNVIFNEIKAIEFCLVSSLCADSVYNCYSYALNCIISWSGFWHSNGDINYNHVFLPQMVE